MEYIASGLRLVILTAPLWAPILLVLIAWNYWIRYIQETALEKIEWKLLQVRLSKNIQKSPLAMELVLMNAFYQTGGVGTWVQKYWQGNTPTYFSLEMVSIEGNVYFFIRTPKKFAQIIRQQIYAQYPQAEVSEVEDYTAMLPEKIQSWGCEFKLSEKDFIPIKTYIDYGMDRTSSLEPEQQIDPMTSMLEFFGSIGKGEQLWMQIVIRPANWARYKEPDGLFKTKNKKWTDIAKDHVKKLREGFQWKKDEGMPLMTEADKQLINAIERSITKFGFDFGIRTLYITEDGKFNPDVIAGVTGSLRQFNAGGGMNGFSVTNATGFDYGWQDPTGKRVQQLKDDLLFAYRNRGFFYSPFHSGKTIGVLTTEELATIYHFPGAVSETPTFSRIDAKKGEPPLNLPL